MTLSPDEFIRRFLLHVLPKGFHRIRHYGLLASAGRKANVARARELLAVPAATAVEDAAPPPDPRPPCPCCGGRMVIIETFQRTAQPRRRTKSRMKPISASTPASDTRATTSASVGFIAKTTRGAWIALGM